MYGFNRLRAVGRVTARDVPPVVFLLSRKVACREAPSNYPGDKCLRAQAGDGVDPRGAVAAVPTAQADREFGHAHAGMGAWVGQHLGGVHTCLTAAGVTRRDEHPRAVGVVTQAHPSESPPGRDPAVADGPTLCPRRSHRVAMERIPEPRAGLGAPGRAELERVRLPQIPHGREAPSRQPRPHPRSHHQAGESINQIADVLGIRPRPTTPPREEEPDSADAKEDPTADA